MVDQGRIDFQDQHDGAHGTFFCTMEGHYNKATELANGLNEKLIMTQEQTEAKKKQALANSSDIKALDQEYQAKLL
jgi:hypothetical protein